MKYVSTGGSSHSVSFDAAVAAGLATDGGLYVPERFPEFDAADFTAGESLGELAPRILAPFVEGSQPASSLHEICRRAFDFPIPLRELTDKEGDGNAWLLELFHGPSSAFKDVGARFLAECMAQQPQAGRRRILVATSGDTGGAVAAAFYRRPGFEVAILFPEKGVSEEQAQQLTCWGENVRSFAVRGSFDDCQRMLKQVLAAGSADPEVSQTTANSINIARLLAQVVYYAFVAIELRGDELPTMIIPSGNLGNATAAVWAKQMGMPIGKIVMVTNANRPLPDYLETGNWQPRASVRTMANAMDVGSPSNMERLMHLYPRVEDLREHVTSISIEDAEIRATIRAGAERWGHIFDPHTATAIAALQRHSVPLPVVIATAHPAKFRSIVEPLLSAALETPPALAALLSRPTRCEPIGASVEELQESLSGQI